MEDYDVPVQNDVTGETTTVQIESVSAKDAQIQALSLVFRQNGWRKASAREPHRTPVEAGSA